MLIRILYAFQSTLPMRGATSDVPHPVVKNFISIHAPHAGSDVRTRLQWPVPAISIHAPHAGSDSQWNLPSLHLWNFNPRSPCGERLVAFEASSICLRFQSTLPMRGATILVRHISSFPDFNPRSPCGERLKHNVCITFAVVISIHAPHAGSDSES